MAIGNVLSIKAAAIRRAARRPAAMRRSPTPSGEDKDGFWPLEKCINAYTTYLDNKTLEIQEQQNARRYRHGAQWTSEQIKTFNDRKQPVVTYNKIGRKIDGIVGLVERLKQDPEGLSAHAAASGRRRPGDRGAALSDGQQQMERGGAAGERGGGGGRPRRHRARSQADAAAEAGRAGHDAGGMGHNGGPPMEPDYDVMFGPVDNDGFFYDPRSFKHDFSDARYLGMGKYVDEELMIELLPGMEDDIKAACDSSLELTSNSDRDNRWFQANGDFKQMRLVDIWYKSKGGWKWALFTGSKILMQGDSPFTDENDKQFAKYLMFSASVDHDGDRYGFARNLQSPQDEVNQRRSKGLHELNNRRIIATKAAVADGNVEALRQEAARADGIVLVNTALDDIRFDDQAKQAADHGATRIHARRRAGDRELRPQRGDCRRRCGQGLVRPRHCADAAGRHCRARPLHDQPARLEDPGLSRAVQRRAELLGQRALDPGHRRPGRAAIRADQRPGARARRHAADGERRSANWMSTSSWTRAPTPSP